MCYVDIFGADTIKRIKEMHYVLEIVSFHPFIVQLKHHSATCLCPPVHTM
jgi:hypothetical protein